MTISDATESAILKLAYQAVTWTDYGISTGSGTPETNISLALHTTDPADAGNMSTNEMTTGAYAGYARASVARTTGGWGVAGTTPTAASPVANIDFPAGTGGTGATAAFFSTGHSGAAAQNILWSGAISPTIACGNGVTPRLTTASTITLD